MTVKQLKDTLKEMKKIYPLDENDTEISTHDLFSYDNSDCVHISTRDKESGIDITMSKYLDD